jgi:ATP-dependent Clp protease adaptor protein ClpS
MEFVQALLERCLGSRGATRSSLHRKGSGVAGMYVLEVAETKVATVHRMAESAGYPLRAGVEEE